MFKKHHAQLTRQEVMGQMSPIRLRALQLPLLITRSPLIRFWKRQNSLKQSRLNDFDYNRWQYKNDA